MKDRPTVRFKAKTLGFILHTLAVGTTVSALEAKGSQTSLYK